VGGRAEEKWRPRFARLGHAGIDDRIGRTTLAELVDLCARAELVVANDSGVAHLASSLAGAPTVVLFGPGDPAYIMPRGPNVVAARVSIPCSPCEKARCRAPCGYQRCLRDLSLDSVLAKVDEIGIKP
jgi:ADP-heptose:LPS heptosyltransferase